LPLEKTRTGDESPAFVVEISYFDRSSVWTDKMHARLALAAVDLPISKSRLLFYHPPLFRPASSGVISGSFRVATYEPPESSSLRSTTTTTNPTESYESEGNESPETKLLLSRLRDSKSATKPARTLPVRVNFPHFGPSIFLVSELTSENQTPFLEMDFQRDKKRGGR
jgi:hypothetical protein